MVKKSTHFNIRIEDFIIPASDCLSLGSWVLSRPVTLAFLMCGGSTTHTRAYAPPGSRSNLRCATRPPPTALPNSLATKPPVTLNRVATRPPDPFYLTHRRPSHQLLYTSGHKATHLLTFALTDSLIIGHTSQGGSKATHTLSHTPMGGLAIGAPLKRWLLNHPFSTKAPHRWPSRWCSSTGWPQVHPPSIASHQQPNCQHPLKRQPQGHSFPHLHSPHRHRGLAIGAHTHVAATKQLALHSHSPAA
ncbi:hypothetical protein AMTR_s00051p00024130 [Amborella trichopoda]|uniref:Uncharacterized protein n=1 Tax=Amborella trichopoda TaxID=13333 RepID=U5D5B4_AMBTC|nr:hypothetical protein AMTR_s00051p00024130 [Amborella trichopoda]